MSDTFLLLGGGVKVLGRLKHGSFLQSEQVRRGRERSGGRVRGRSEVTTPLGGPSPKSLLHSQEKVEEVSPGKPWFDEPRGL